MDVSDRRMQVQLTQEAKIASDFLYIRAIFAVVGFVSALPCALRRHMTFSPMMLRSPRGAMRGLDNVFHLLRWNHFPV